MKKVRSIELTKISFGFFHRNGMSSALLSREQLHSKLVARAAATSEAFILRDVHGLAAPLAISMA